MPEPRELLLKAAREIRALQARLDAMEGKSGEAVAVVGIGCRFPAARGPEEFWNLLRSGHDAVSAVPATRWPDAGDRLYARTGGFLDAVDELDAAFFGISPREAAALDPQQRLLLETSWESLEHAAIAPTSLSGSRTGVFFGIGMDDYGRMQAIETGSSNPYAGTGNGFCFASGRVSHALGLNGPSVSLDTACSSSLVAVHLACQSLRAGESDAALAGGVNLILSPEVSLYLCELRALSHSGRCRTFDAGADGYVRGEGCGVVVLQRLRDAVAKGSRILAVIRGSAVNHDGASSGLTAPNGTAQRQVMREALRRARIEPGDVDYIEAHGTGTILGDPIEFAALADVYGQRSKPLWIGSVKTNIGHLEPAAGIAGLIKAILSVERGVIPPHLHLRSVNPHIDLGAIPAAIPLREEAWAGRRAAGVSAFGLSGTNAHVIVEQFQGQAGELLPDRKYHVLCISGRTEAAAAESARRLSESLNQPLRNIAFTLCNGRSHFNYRAAVVAGDADEARRRLAEMKPRRVASDALRIAFLFSGQGSQYPGMGRALYAAEPVYRDALDRCAAAVDIPLLEFLKPEMDATALAETGFTQPALFSLEIALFELWKSWGIQPSAVAGHSLGEYVAACVAGVFSLEDGLKLAAARGRLMQALPPGGSMLAAQERPGVIGPLPAGSAIAAVNAPNETVISGETSAIVRLQYALRARGIDCRLLRVSHAFHSALMEPMLEPFGRVLREVVFSPPSIPVIANRTGRQAGLEICSAEYWLAHIREAVLFGQTVETLAETCDAFLELGPDPVLLSLARRIHRDLPGAGSLRRGRDDGRQMAEAAAVLYSLGASPRVGPGERVTLPTYPFERKRHWFQKAASGSLIGRQLNSPLPQIQFETEFNTATIPLTGDHVVYGRAVVSGPTEVAMTVEAVSRFMPGTAIVLEDVSFVEPMVLQPAESRTVQIIFDPRAGQPHAGEARWSFEIQSYAGEWKRHASGTLRAEAVEPPKERESVEAILFRCRTHSTGAELYRGVQTRAGFTFGRSYLWIEELWRRPGEAVGRMRLPDDADLEWEGLPLHPGLHDSCFQVFGAASRTLMEDGIDEAVIPVGVDEVRFYRKPAGRLWCHAALWPGEESRRDMFAGDYWMFDESGALVVEGRGLRLRRVPMEVMLRGVEDHLYRVEWKPRAGGAVSAGEECRILRTPSYDELLAVVREGASQLSPSRIRIVTRGAQSINGETADPEQAKLWGLGRVLALEHPEMFDGMIDLDALSTDNARDEEFVRSEPGNSGEQIAIRGNQRLVARMVRWHALARPIQFDPHATYLIAGGTGALGQHLAQWMLDHGAGRLILTARRPKARPPHPDVHAVAADLANLQDMERVFASVDRCYPLRGIFHTAGVRRDGTLAGPITAMDEVFAPKVSGSWNLHLLSERISLEWFVLFSSGASLTGSPGQGAYAAANAYQDALAHYRRARGLPATSIHWGAWEGAGMASHAPAKGHRPLPVTRALESLERILAGAPAEVAVLDMDWPHFAGSGLPIFDEVAPRKESVAPLPCVSSGEESVPELLRRELRKVLGLEASAPLGPRDRFFELGMDSLMAIELKNRLQARLGRSLPATLVMDHPDLESLEKWLSPVPASRVTDRKSIEQLTEQEAESLLIQTLQGSAQA